MSSLIKIVCANCGAQYRLPETFQSPSAKCKKCGATIDVAGQRQGVSAAPAAKPAAPAAKAAAAADEPAAPARSARSSRGRGAAAGETRGARGSRRSGGSSRRSRRGGDEGDEGGKRGGNKALVWGGVLGGLAVVVVVLVFVLKGSGDEPTKTETAKQDEVKAPPPPAAPPAAEETAKQAEAAAAKQPAPEPAEAAAKEKAKPAPETAAKPKEIKTAEDVFNPKTALQPLEWPEYVSADDRAVVMQLLEDVENGGAPGIKAKTALEQMGHKALAGIINKLREVDYTDAWESQHAYELHQLLGVMTIGMNVGFKAVEADAEIPLETADWNARTAKAWQDLLKRHPTKEEFAKWIAERKAKGEDK
jgi:hypothetical protein